ncbi:MAG: protein translocase subunit SecD [Synergistetes bacterium]|nr:protein translocase subunit SecD [Synergistota bacterium]
MKRRDLIRLAIIAGIIVAAIAYLFPIEGKIRLGLDLKGGSHIILQCVPTPNAPVTEDSVNRVLEILRNRIDQFGVTEPVIQRAGTNRILVQLPGVKDPQAAMELLGKTALLEFREVVNVGPEKPLKPQRKNYSSENEYEEALKNYKEAMKEYEDTIKKFKERTKKERELSVNFNRETGRVYLLGKTWLTGKYLKNARTTFDRFGTPAVSLEFNSEGAKLFEEATRKNVGRQLAIVLDGNVISAPVVQEVISGGKAQITGDFTLREAQKLAILLRAGALPVKVEVIENRTIGPTLGQDSIRKGIKAGLFGGALVFIFMLIYYGLMGLVADLALAVNILLIFAALAGLEATLTLPGIAGIVLNIGMAVDGNILIFERIKEELREGKTMRASIDAGFRKAFRTIFDANVTTLIAAAVLFYFGSGPIKGFAVTLSLGVIISMFTAIVVTRSILDVLVSMKVKALRVLMVPKVKEG